MITMPYDNPAFKSPTLPESIYDKVEQTALRYAMNPSMLNYYVNLTDSEYMAIADTIDNELLEISVDYYRNPKYYPSMPEPLFEALNSAFLDRMKTVFVDKSQFDEMMRDVNNRGSFIRHAQ